MESYWCNRLITHWENRKVRFLPVLHYDMLIKCDLMGSKYLFISTCLLLLMHSRSSPMIWGASLAISIMCLISIVRVASSTIPTIWITAHLLKLCFILLKLYFLVRHSRFKSLICSSHHLKSFLVSILYSLHLNAQIFNRLVQIFYHWCKLIILLD